MTEKLISLHLNANQPDLFEQFVESLIIYTNNIKILEILVHIDAGDQDMKKSISKYDKYDGLIQYFETNLIKNFSHAWKPLNILLQKTSPSVKLISCVSDELRIITHSWDEKLLNIYKKNSNSILRIRCSKNKNYIYDDIWQCGYAPDAYSFYSKKWMTVIGMWCPCIGPDTFQECISFYLKKQIKNKNLELVSNDIDLQGESVSEGMNLSKRLQRTRIYYKAFFKLMSYDMQKNALNSSKRIISEIKKIDPNLSIDEYNLSYMKINYTNFCRRFNYFKHRGSPNHPINNILKNIVFLIWCYSYIFDKILENFLKYLYKKNLLKLLFKDSSQYKHLEKILEIEK